MTQTVSNPNSGTDLSSDELLDQFFGADDEEQQGSSKTNENTDLDADNEELDASDTSDEEEDQADQDSEDESQDESDEGDEQDGGYTDHSKKVRLADGTETTVKQLIEGNLKNADYTRKTQELSNTRKELEARDSFLKQQEITLDLAAEILLSQLPEQPTQELLQTNPLAYMQQKELFQAKLIEIAQLKQAKQSQIENVKVEQQKQHNQWVESEREKLATHMPELTDPNKADAFSKTLSKTVSKYGFSDDDLADMYDHRFYLIARDLHEYHKLMANKPQALEKVKGKPPISPTRRTPDGKNRIGDLQKHKQSGGKDQAALDRLLDDFF